MSYKDEINTRSITPPWMFKYLEWCEEIAKEKQPKEFPSFDYIIDQFDKGSNLFKAPANCHFNLYKCFLISRARSPLVRRQNFSEHISYYDIEKSTKDLTD